MRRSSACPQATRRNSRSPILRIPPPSYKGQTAHLQGRRSRKCKRKVLPELDDEFVQSLGEYTDLADYRAKKLDELRKQREAEAEQAERRCCRGLDRQGDDSLPARRG